MFSSDPSISNTVHFWCKQVVLSLKNTAAPALAESTATSAPAGKAASARPGAAASAPEGKTTFASIVKDKFAVWLLRELYKFRCFEVLREFVKVLEELVEAGCRPPGDLQALKNFSETRVDDSTADMSVVIDTGGLESRLAFFNSMLYKDFVDIRARRMLSAAQHASVRGDRDARLKALAHVSRETGRPEDCPLKREACWARSMLDVQIDVSTRLGFALQRDTADRVNFAMRFKRLDDCDEGLHWGAVKSLVEAVDVPAGVPEKDWEGALDLFVREGLKKNISNPVAVLYADFKADLSAAFAPDDAWVPDLLTAARRARIACPDWGSAPEFDGSNLEEKSVVTAAKALGKLFTSKVPQWVTTLKDKAAKIKSQAKSSAEATPTKGSGTASAADAPDSAAEASPTAASPAAAQAAAPAALQDFYIGDTVLLDMTVQKKCQGANAVVKKITPKELHVEAMTCSGNMNKKVKRTQCAVVIAGDLRRAATAALQAQTAAGAPAPTAAVAPAPTAAVAPAQTAAGSPEAPPPAAPPLESQTPTESISGEQEAEAKRMANELFGDFEE